MGFGRTAGIKLTIILMLIWRRAWVRLGNIAQGHNWDNSVSFSIDLCEVESAHVDMRADYPLNPRQAVLVNRHNTSLPI